MIELSANGIVRQSRWWAVLGCLVSSCCLAADAPVVGPYQVIIDRNPFGLNQAAPPSDAPMPKVVERPALKLTGIAKFDGQRMAYLVREERGQPLEYLNLAEGRSQGTIQIRAVDEQAGAVNVVVDGVEWMISFGEQAAYARAMRQEEEQFVIEHTRAHEEHERRELIRVEKERAEAEIELKSRTEAEQKQAGHPPAVSEIRPPGSEHDAHPNRFKVERNQSDEAPRLAAVRLTAGKGAPTHPATTK